MYTSPRYYHFSDQIIELVLIIICKIEENYASWSFNIYIIYIIFSYSLVHKLQFIFLAQLAASTGFMSKSRQFFFFTVLFRWCYVRRFIFVPFLWKKPILVNKRAMGHSPLLSNHIRYKSDLWIIYEESGQSSRIDSYHKDFQNFLQIFLC